MKNEKLDVMVEQNKPRHDDYVVDLLLAITMAAVFTICFFKTFF